MKLTNKAPNQLRYFLATPFTLLADLLGVISVLIMGRVNSRWQMLKTMEDAGMLEVLTPEEYKAKYGKLPKSPESEEDNQER